MLFRQMVPGDNARNFAWLVAGVMLMISMASDACCQDRTFRLHERLTLGTESNLSASVRISDVDGNGFPDVIVSNGRHWPQQNYVFLNQGKARFTVRRPIGRDGCTSYATEPADLDGDGDDDLVVGNDMAPNQIFRNDGAGNFRPFGPFGQISSLRSIELHDIDNDQDVDILVTCRGSQNRIYLNDGKGQFKPGSSFGTQRDSTIDVAVTDWNSDGHWDLALANRDGQRNAILLNDGQGNFSTAIPFGEKGHTRAIVAADLNGDNKPDLVAGNIGHANRVYLGDGKGGIAQSIDLGRKDGRTYCLGVADLDNDNRLDIIVGNVGQPNAVYFNTGNGTKFKEVRFGNESTATYGLDTGDLDGDGFLDIVVANSGAPNFVLLNRPGKTPK